MTTAHRPTWKAAVGKSNEGGWTAGGAPGGQRSALSLPGHTKLKTRRDTETISKERHEILQKSLQKLRDMEAKKLGPRVIDERMEEEGRRKLLMATADIDEEALRKKYDDGDADEDNGGGESKKKDNGRDGWSDIEEAIADDESDLDASDSDDDDDDTDDDSDDEDEEAALLAELAKIRSEREAVKQKAEAEAEAEEQGRMEEAALIGNPLLSSADISSSGGGGNGGGSAPISGKIKRRWNDDVVFRNQTKGEPEQKKRFINDTVRNDFHKRFLNKFIK